MILEAPYLWPEKKCTEMNIVKLKAKQLSHKVLSLRATERVLLTGFWRSGTTWLQQSVQDRTGAQCIFEPFSPACGHTWGGFHKYDDNPNHHVYMPADMNSLTEGDHVNLKRSFDGVAPNGYGYILSPDFSDALSRTVLVKSTRLGFILPEIIDLYKVRTLHIRRHPAAVFCSLLNTNWSWKFSDVRFSEVYANHIAPNPYIEKLMEFDQNSVMRFAALWALSEAGAQKAINLKLADLIFYEDILSDQQILSNYFSKSLDPPAAYTTSRDSPVTEDNRKNLSATKRAHDWMDRISATDLKLLEKTIQKLAPEIHANYFWPDNKQYAY